jgi:hypothetical protein
MNLFLIAGWDKNLKYIYALCYAYIIYRLIPIIKTKVWVYTFLNLEICTTYTKIFQLIFKILGDAA